MCVTVFYLLCGVERFRYAVVEYGVWGSYRGGNPTFGDIMGCVVRNLSCWSGDLHIRIDRLGRESNIVSQACLSMICGIQPDGLRRYFAVAEEKAINDGLVACRSQIVTTDAASNV